MSVKAFPLQNASVSFGEDVIHRMLRDAMEPGIGVMGYEDYRVRQRGAGANMSVDVGAGDAYVRFSTPEGGARQVNNSAISNSGTPGAPNSPDWTATFNSSDGTNPRIDRVVLQVRDSLLDAGGNFDSVLRVVVGTATGGATLDNLTGAAAVPVNSLHLADVLIPALSTSITDANIRDRRPMADPGALPPLLSDIDMVQFVPAAGLTHSPGAALDHTLHDTLQVAAAMFLPRRIVGATRIRWKYVHSGTALAGNYNFGLYDASGRLIVSTGSVAFTGALNSIQVRSETISATTFEAGWYWVFLGLDTTVGAAWTRGIILSQIAGTSVGVPYVNIGVGGAAGGVTLPTTLLAQTDLGGFASASNLPAVPIIALSIG